MTRAWPRLSTRSGISSGALLPLTLMTASGTAAGPGTEPARIRQSLTAWRRDARDAQPAERTMLAANAPCCHAVVFDVNVYLDVAELLGPPFTWQKFNQAAATHQSTILRGSDRRIDSLRALALATTGRFAGPDALQVWTSAHIDGLVATKAAQPLEAAHPDDRGLGWSEDDAEDLVDDLIWTLVYDKSGGGACRNIEIPYGCPPLSHEDGIVYRSAEQCGDDGASRYCVTNDRHFRQAALPGAIQVLYPHEWILLVRKSRFAASAPRPGSPAPRQQLSPPVGS
jgi:hypothetical protein